MKQKLFNIMNINKIINMSVLVYTENWDGKFKKLSFELVSYATGIAKMLNTTVTAVSIGKVDEDELKKAGKLWCR